MWQSVAEAHAALNDFPAALLVLSVVFELAGAWSRKDSLRAAGFWTLIAGTVGLGLAVLTGLSARDSIEHGADIHRLMARHQTLALTAGAWFLGLTLWRVWRRAGIRGPEARVYLGAAALGAALIVWVGHVGGNVVFRHAGGIPTRVLEAGLQDRTAGHSHAPGEEHDPPAAPQVDVGGQERQDSQGGADHVDPPGTPPHTHD